MAYYGTARSPSFFDNFTLNPLPYPVILILLVLTFFLSFHWYSSYEEVVESAEEGLGWALFVIPVALLFLVKWLSTFESPPGGWIFGSSPYDRRLRQSYWPSSEEGASPWGVLALIVLLLVLIQFQGSLFEW